MAIRIVIPVPTQKDPAYNERALPLYIKALEVFGAVPVLISYDIKEEEKAKIISSAQGVLLPGCRFDVEPERYREAAIPECGELDPARTAMDELLLQDAFNLRKPVLGICHGAQSLNVWRGGTLFQDLKTQVGNRVNHSPGRDITEAHPVRIESGSRIACLLNKAQASPIMINSSHHQAIRVVGDNLRPSAVSPEDGVIEAVELNSSDHFVLGVQWHPERTRENALSQAIFEAFIQAAAGWQEPQSNGKEMEL